MNPSISDLSINPFCFIFASSVGLVNLLWLAVVKYLDLMSNIFPSKSVFWLNLRTSDNLF